MTLPIGGAHPLPVPEALFSSVSVDWFTLPETPAGYNRVAVYVCRLSKYVRLVPGRSDETAEDEATKFAKEWVWGEARGFPQEIMSDRDPTFRSRFWTKLLETAGVELKLTCNKTDS